ncbi:MAG: leucyl aminopeptidase [Myxococcota bacterium]
MLEIDWSGDEPAATAGQFLAVPHAADQDPETVAERFGEAIRDAVISAPFAGKPGETFAFTREFGGALQHVKLFGIGEGLDDAAAVRQLAHDAIREGQAVGANTVVLDLAGQPIVDGSDALPAPAVGALIAQGAELGTYAYERFLSESKRKPRSVRKVHVRADSTSAAEGTRRGQISADAIARARDLGNGPPQLVTPSFLAATATEIVDGLKGEHDVSLTILERSECEARGMGCYLGVSLGSEQPPKFIHMSYKPKGTSKGRVCLVGKGVTFDSGGYSLKPTDGMLDMKMDMCGAAAVIGAFEGAVRLQCPYELHTIVAATENLVSGAAYKLGDVLTASNGKTVEINNTDAEGRLTLADALVYAAKLEPTVVLDFATLTGACLVALGPKIAGVMTRDEALLADWNAAAAASSEEMWRLPLPDDLKEQLKSKVADMKNTGERWGGALTAGLFLSEFTEGLRWMHVDIAGPAMASKAYGVTTPGSSGFPVATILELLARDLSPAKP